MNTGFFRMLLCLIIFCTVCGGVLAQPSVSLVRNPSFEGGSGDNGNGGGVPEWNPEGAGYHVDRNVFHSGQQSIRCDSLNPAADMGAEQTIVLNQKAPHPILFSAWSRADSVSNAHPSDYSLWIDVTYADGTHQYGDIVPFDAGTHDWERVQETVLPHKPVAQMNVYLLFRQHTGTAWFDDAKAYQLKGSTLFDQQRHRKLPACSCSALHSIRCR